MLNIARLLALVPLVYLGALVSVAADAAAAPTAQGNLITDPSFSTLSADEIERNFWRNAHAGWTISDLSDQTGDLHFAKGKGPQGSNALITAVSSGAYAISAPIKVTPQSVYTLSVFLDSRGNTSNGNVGFYIKDTKTGQVLQDYKTEEGTDGRVVFPSWTAPRGATSVQLVFAINSTGVTGNVVFAQPELRHGKYAPVQPTAAVIAATHPAQRETSVSDYSKWRELAVLIAVGALIIIGIYVAKRISPQNETASEDLKESLTERRTTSLVVALATLVPCALLLYPGNMFYVDWHSHVFTLNYFGEYIREHGILPSTMSTNVMLGGANPAFYGVLFYPIIGLVSAVIGANLAVRLALIGAVLLQSWQVFATGRALSGNRWLAYTLVVAVDASIYALTNLYNRSDLTEFVSVALLTAAIASWLRAPYAHRPIYVYLQSSLFLGLAMTTHPIIVLLGGPALIIVALLALPQNWRLTAKGAAIVCAVQLVVLSPWLYSYFTYHPFVQLGSSLLSSAPAYLAGVDTPWALFHITPYDGRMGGAVLPSTPNLDAQLNMLLGAVVVWLGIEVYRRHRRLIPAALAVAIGLLVGLYSAFPQAGAALHVLGTIQIAFRLISYSDLFLLVAAFLLAAQLRGTSGSRYVAAFAVVVVLATTTVILKETRANVYPGIEVGSNVFANRDVVTTMWSTGADYAVPIHKIDTVNNPTQVALSVGTGSQFGEPQVVHTTAPAGAVVVTNVQSFPWNHLVLNGRVLPPADEVLVAVPQVAGIWNIQLALGFRSLGGRQSVGLVTQPDAAWLILRFISFWSVVALAGVILWGAIGLRSAAGVPSVLEALKRAMRNPVSSIAASLASDAPSRDRD